MHPLNPSGSAVGPDGFRAAPADEPKTVQYWVHTFTMRHRHRAIWYEPRAARTNQGNQRNIL